jgi:hypothetical protein
MTTPVSTAQVLERFLPDYRAAHQLSPQQAKVLTSIDCCRTPVLGGQYLVCGHCGYSQERFHSCRNRHCPQCQKLASADWLERRREDILPVPYYHLVFTLPHALNGWVQLHPEVIYSLLFKAVSTTLKQFGRDPKRLDGEVGMTLVLHTWGQNLSQHVHLHCLIPGGALGQDGESWHAARSTYLFPVKALSRCYRGHMVRLLRQAWNRQSLNRIHDPGQVDDILDYVMNQPWVVFARPTSQHTDQVLIYLSRYTYRIAISDRRLVSMDEQRVFFRWKNYRAGGQQQAMSLTGEEFIRRWLLHVLPHGLMRIRHYGFLANCHRRKKLEQIRRCFASGVAMESSASVETTTVVRPIVAQVSYCPKCREGCLQVVSEIDPRRRRLTP